MAETSQSIELIPGRSIGSLQLGEDRSSLPERAQFDKYGGQVDGVQFVFGDDGRISDIWIDDIRTFPHRLMLGARDVPKKAPILELQQFFGPCVEVEGVKGGRFYNCSTGVALGCAYDGSDSHVQLRIKHR